MPTRRSQPPTCPSCGEYPRAKRQATCRRCARVLRVFASNEEVAVAHRAALLIVPALDGLTQLDTYAALARLKMRKVLTHGERLLLGELLWLYADVLHDLAGVEDPVADRLYRKLMGHDRNGTPTHRYG